MAKIFDAAQYKFAQIVCKDLAAVLIIVDDSIKKLQPYQQYTRAAKALSDLKEHRVIIKSQIDKYSVILQSKGLTDN